MTTLSFSLAQSEAEVDLAFELALSIFEPMSAVKSYRQHKTLLWKQDPTYAVGNFVLACSPQGSVCGLIRIVPRVIFRGPEKFFVAGISSVCLAPDYRGQGNSVGLIKFAVDHCKARSFDFAFLFARRAADNFYTQFGFHGVSSYSHISVRSKKLPFDSRFSVEPACKAHIDLYAFAYERSYAAVFGRVERSRDYWEFVLDRCAHSSLEKIETICFEGKPIGYLVAGATTVLELATSARMNADGLVAFLSHQFQPDATAGILCLDVPPQHDFVGQLAGMDMTLSLRECAYGGHMARILNGDDTPSHADTCRTLGAYAISVSQESSRPALPYQMSILDHF
jgi:GNAT superfamily N-acetyltransferase